MTVSPERGLFFMVLGALALKTQISAVTDN